MIRIPQLVAGLACAALFSCTDRADAAEPVFGDGRASAAPEILAILGESESGVVTSQQAVRIVAAIKADMAIDQAELDLIDEITVDKSRLIDIRPLSAEEPKRVIGTLSGSSQKAVLALFDELYASLYGAEDAQAGWEALVRQSLISPSANVRVRKFLLPIASAKFQESNLENRYEPVRDLIAAWVAQQALLPADLQEPSGWLIYDSFKQVDQDMGDRLPGAFYDWTKPKPSE